MLNTYGVYVRMLTSLFTDFNCSDILSIDLLFKDNLFPIASSEAIKHRISCSNWR
jgi:hypothetical protein